MNTIIITLLIYVVAIFLVAWYFSRNESLSAYLINKRSTGLWTLTFANVATIMGGGAVIPIIAEVYRTGIGFGIALPVSFITGMIILAIVAKQIKIIGDKYNAHTIADFFGVRFGKKNQKLSSLIQVFMLVIWTSVQAIAIASLASVLIGVNYTLALVIGAVVTIAYTAIGGLKIDIITDFIQFWFITIVFLIMAAIGWSHTGGLSNILSQLPEGHLDPFAFAGVGWFVGIIVLSGFIYLGSTVHWQRIFSAKNENVARKSFWWSLPFMAGLSLIVLFLGLVSVVTLSDIQAETAVFELMTTMLPPVVAGLGFAAVLAVIMSSIDSFLVGGSTILYRAFNKNNDDDKKELRQVRLVTAVFGTLSFLIAFLVPNIITIGLYATYLAMIFVPPALAGLYSQKVSGNAIFYALLVSTIALVILFPIIGENTFLITTILSVLITFLYDKAQGLVISRRKTTLSLYHYHRRY